MLKCPGLGLMPRQWLRSTGGVTQRVMENIQNTETQQKGKPVTW